MKDVRLLLPLLATLAACRGSVPAFTTPFAGAPASASRLPPTELDYHSPPVATSAAVLGDGRIRLAGRATPSSRVRLASPSGQAQFAETGPDGVWRIDAPPSDRTRLFGLAMEIAGQWIQSEGYLAVTPRGEVAQLRSGAGARVIGSGDDLRLEAVDFDSKGGVVVSGRATAGSPVEVWVDGSKGGRGIAGPDGRFSVALAAPLALQGHQLAVSHETRRVAVQAALSPAAPLSGGPFRAGVTPSGWRIDWITPGGGLQSTLLVSPPRPEARATGAARG